MHESLLCFQFFRSFSLMPFSCWASLMLNHSKQGTRQCPQSQLFSLPVPEKTQTIPTNRFLDYTKIVAISEKIQIYIDLSSKQIQKFSILYSLFRLASRVFGCFKHMSFLLQSIYRIDNALDRFRWIEKPKIQP